MCFLYCITSLVLRDDHYKIGMTLCKDEKTLLSYLKRRYGTSYGCSVKIVLFKKVSNPRIAEKYVHATLAVYCKGGEIYNCDTTLISNAFDSIPNTEQYHNITKPKLPVIEVIKKHTTIPHDFIDMFSSVYSPDVKEDKFVINIDSLVKWLSVQKDTLTRTLKNSYKMGTDYKIERIARDPSLKYGSNNLIRVMLTPDCMKQLFMRSRSDKANIVRGYLIDIEKCLMKYNKKKTSIM